MDEEVHATKLKVVSCKLDINTSLSNYLWILNVSL